MNVSIDYDDTYTRDPKVWDEFIRIFRERGHFVYCVTMRSASGKEYEEVFQDLHSKVDGIYFTNRKAKQKFMFDMGISIDVWVDDCPYFILENARG